LLKTLFEDGSEAGGMEDRVLEYINKMKMLVALLGLVLLNDRPRRMGSGVRRNDGRYKSTTT
jgi:hypothetical protein